MSVIERNGEDFVVGADLLAEAFGLEAGDVPELMKAGRITSRCETGTEADAGSWRLTFWHGTRACRFTVDGTGAILRRARFDATARDTAKV